MAPSIWKLSCLVSLRPAVVTSRPVLYYYMSGNICCPVVCKYPDITQGPPVEQYHLYLKENPACCKQPRPDLVASHQDRKSPSFWSQSGFHHSRASQEHSRARYNRQETDKAVTAIDKPGCVLDRMVSLHRLTACWL